MNRLIALTGTSGAMGGEALLSLMNSDKHLFVRCLIHKNGRKTPKFVKQVLKKHKDRIEIFNGDISSFDDCAKLVDGASYVINCASIIPPNSDHNPEKTYKSNFIGTKNIVDAIIASGRADEIKLVHIATVAMYGHREYPHVWIRVGDPIIASDYDVYSETKLKAEKYVLESGLKHFVSLRQTAVLHKYMFKNNLKDGLMFHTVWNGTLEWVTDRDSGILIKNLVEKDLDGGLNGFWNKIYNIGGGDNCRITGYETFDECFKLVGGGAKKYFKPNWNISRNFHGGWFADSDELNDILNFRTEDTKAFWKRMGKKYWYFKLGALLPPALVSSLFIKRLFKNTNAPAYWYKHNKNGRMKAFFGGREKYEKLPKNWKDFDLLCEKEGYKEFKEEYLLDHGYDESKPLSSLTLEDLQKAAAFRGGKCLEETYAEGGIYNKLRWQCREGHEFELTPYTVLKGGYWCPHCCEPKPWKYGAVADIPFYGQVYFDSHTADEVGDIYPLDEHEEDFIKK